MVGDLPESSSDRSYAGERLERRRVNYHEVLTATVRRQLRRYRGTPLKIESHDPEIAIYRDAIDFFLPLYGVRDWVWTGSDGRPAQRKPWLWSAGRLAAEAVWRAPAAYLGHRSRVRALASAPHRPVTSDLARAVFIRADHVFGVTAGGSVGHLAGVIGGMRNEGVTVEVVSSDRLAGVPEDGRFHLVRPDYGWVRNVPELPRLVYNRQLEEFISSRWEEWKPDFVYHRYSMHSYIGPALRARFGVPYVCEYNGSFSWMNRHWGKRPMYFEGLSDEIEMLNLQRADLVVVVSRAMADEVIGRGVIPEKVVINPNGVNPAMYHPGLGGDAVRERYGIGEKLVVGFIGTFGPWHGAEKLVQAAAHISRTRPDVVASLHFLLIGDGEGMAAVRGLVDENGLEGVVTLTGRVPQEQGPSHLAACDILASPHVPNLDGTPFFGSPTKLFEYMAMGRAIVASDLDQIGEVLDHGETGWLVRPGDPAALAQGIVSLALDPGLRDRLGGNARRAAETRHSWDAHTRRILEALREKLPWSTAAAAAG